jgi:adenylate cyclase
LSARWRSIRGQLAGALAGRVLDQMTDTAAADIARAEELAGRGLAASPRSPLAHLAKGQVFRAQGRYQEAIPEYETVLAFNRNAVIAIYALSSCKLYTGSIEEVIPVVEQAIRLSPSDPYIGRSYIRIALVHLLQSHIDEAIVWSEKARSANPGHPSPHAYLASACALKGDTERAAAELAEARRRSGDDRFSSLSRLKAVGYFGVPKVQALHETTFFAGLRKAGMPEE